MIQENWFSYPVWHTMAEYEQQHNLLRYCVLRKLYDKGNKLTNIGGWQSSSLNVNTDETIFSFSKFLEPYIASLSEKFGRKLKIINLWININGYGTYNHIHIHPDSIFSGVYYVKAEEDQGDLFFESPLSHLNLFMFGKHFIEEKIYYKPKTGKLILFPAFLPHGVLTNTTNNDRISIAFNLTRE